MTYLKNIISLKLYNRSILVTALFIIIHTGSNAQNPVQEYIDKWQSFYPSRILQMGVHEAIYKLENYDAGHIDSWVKYNNDVQKTLENKNDFFSNDERINVRLLKNHLRQEIYKWEVERLHENSIRRYEEIISNALKVVWNSEYLSAHEKIQLTKSRLEQVTQLCAVAIKNLKRSEAKEVSRSVKNLSVTGAYIQKEIPQIVELWNGSTDKKEIRSLSQIAFSAIEKFIRFAENDLPNSDAKVSLGRDEYARRLALYTDGDMTPERLAQLALKEIEVVRDLIRNVSELYLTEQYRDIKLSEQWIDNVMQAFKDMETDVPKNGSEYLEFWLTLTDSITQFISKEQIATLPNFQTLEIKSAPESAGPAARIGWVSNASVFDPNPVTTLFLPSIPDTFPVREQLDFWASFNKPFNRFIVIHELYPGHYMQGKIARENPHKIRHLFPYGPYAEGWGTFVERVVLDAGWEKQNKLTFLAHLRKRLENANRAYTSVMVHCNGWNEEAVQAFSTDMSLLAPQFAKSLWGRLIRSPMQMTSYFVGGEQFKKLLEFEKRRLKKDFNLKYFMDTILRAGAIPIDEFEHILKNNN